MLTRFLIVILAILNVGVALWWMMPRTEPAPVPAKPEPGVATLEVLPTPAPAAAAQADAAPAAGVAPTTTMLEVTRLAIPGQLVELEGTAVA